MRKSTFLRYQNLYIEFISFRSRTGCSQKEFCRQTGTLPMTLTRALHAADSGQIDFTRPWPENGSSYQVQADMKKAEPVEEAPVMEFVEVFL